MPDEARWPRGASVFWSPQRPPRRFAAEKQRGLSRKDVAFVVHPHPQLHKTGRPVFDVLVEVSHGAFRLSFDPGPPSDLPGFTGLLPCLLLQLLSPPNQQLQSGLVQGDHAQGCPLSERVFAERLSELPLLLVPVLPAVQNKKLLQDSLPSSSCDGGFCLRASREGIVRRLLAFIRDLATRLMERRRANFVAAD